MAAAFSLTPVGCEEGAEQGSGCDNDRDCKGDRLCIDGFCEGPADSASSATSAGDASADGTSANGTVAEETSAGETATPGSTSGDSSGDGSTDEPPLQPYGKCILTCETDADCCAELSCSGDTTYVCDDGLCRGDCQPSCDRSDLGGRVWTCITAELAPPDSTFCGLPCEGNSCSSLGGDFYCHTQGAYSPDACGVDCATPGITCNGTNGAACLPNGDCGCYGDGDCNPGFTCYRAWE